MMFRRGILDFGLLLLQEIGNQSRAKSMFPESLPIKPEIQYYLLH